MFERLIAAAVALVLTTAALGVLLLDILWLLGRPLPVSGRHLLECQIGPLMACAVVLWGELSRRWGE